MSNSTAMGEKLDEYPEAGVKYSKHTVQQTTITKLISHHSLFSEANGTLEGLIE